MLKRLREIVTVVLSANFTTTATTAASTNLSFAIGPNETWFVDVQLTTQCSSTGGSKFAVSAPTGAAIEGWIYSSLAAITTLSYQRLTAIATLSATALHTVATTPAPDKLQFVIQNGSTAGTVTIQAASVTSGQTTTIFLNSGLRATRAS
jgi:hypothetical protein